MPLTCAGALVSGGREGAGYSGWSKSKREMDEAAPLNLDPARLLRTGLGIPKLFDQVHQHGLTGLLGFGERLKG
jgi:hypothetical protein